MNRLKLSLFTLSILFTLTFISGCGEDDNKAGAVPNYFENKSKKSQALAEVLPGFESVKMFTLISSDDILKDSPNFLYGGAPDGQGFLKNPDGSGYIMVTNHENAYSISRVYLDKELNPIKGEYILDTEGGMFRLCSGSLATAEHGFDSPVFLSTGESNVNAMTHAIDPIGAADPKNKTRTKPALGKFSGENSVPLTQAAYPGKTVIILGEDAGDGQVYLYVSAKKADLEDGKLYALKRTNDDQIEINMEIGPSHTYDVEFVEVPDAKSLTGEQIEALNSTLKSIQFARVEDLDYRKGSAESNREVYFTATGIRNAPEKTYFGRVYRLKLAASDPTKGGKLDIIADGDTDKGKDIINPDNLCVTENFVYIQEDGDSYFPEATHNSIIWQYDIAKGQKVRFIEAKNQYFRGTRFNSSSDNRFGAWEYGAMIDISDIVGVPGTFTLNIHPHTWKEGEGGKRFANPSKVSAPRDYTSGGQTLILANVPR